MHSYVAPQVLFLKDVREVSQLWHRHLECLRKARELSPYPLVGNSDLRPVDLIIWQRRERQASAFTVIT